MKHLVFGLLLLFSGMLIAQTSPATYSTQGNKGTDAFTALEALSANTRQSYIDSYKGVAMAEMNRTGIPASIKLAQGILESNAGQSELALAANNHFGIKCGGEWNGRTYSKIDDDKDAAGNVVASCFRKYEKVEESFLDHSEFLRDPRKYNRYGFLFNLDRRDYRGWARGLQAAGYATSITYADNLISVIERYQLFQFDYGDESPVTGIDPVTGRPSATVPLQRIGRINDVKVVLSEEGETLAEIAKAYKIKTEKIVEYNDRGYAPNERLPANERVFLQTKRNRWRGKAAQHLVKSGQTMFEISQLYGMKLAKLYFYNRMEDNQQPAAGESLNLKRRRASSDLVILRDAKDIKPKPQPGKLQPADDELFEIGADNKVKTNNTPPPPTVTSPPVKPATTGVPFPNDPVPSAPVITPGSNTPPPGTMTTPPAKPQQPAAGGNFVYHTVVKGDTLFNISRRYNTTVEKIRQLNGLSDNSIRIGQNLKVQVQ